MKKTIVNQKKVEKYKNKIQKKKKKEMILRIIIYQIKIKST